MNSKTYQLCKNVSRRTQSNLMFYFWPFSILSCFTCETHNLDPFCSLLYPFIF